MKIAYLILAHKNIEQIYMLIDILISHQDNYVFIHLDSKFKPQINESYLTHDRINFIEERVNVSWGGFSVVKATQLLLKEAYSNNDFDYYILLSGQCLPIKSQNEIREFLKNKNEYSFLETTNKVDNKSYLNRFYYPVFFDALNFIKVDRLKIGQRRPYIKKMIVCWVRKIYETMGIKRKIPSGIEPYFGSQWWVLHKEHVKYVLELIEKRTDLVKYFRFTWAPDELFYHSILYSSPLRDKIVNRSLWYIDWNANGPPKTLTLDDLEKLETSDSYFARKFDCEVEKGIIEKVVERVSDSHRRYDFETV